MANAEEMTNRNYAGFADPMQCFYSKSGAAIRSERASLDSRLQVSSADLAPLDVQADRVELCDRGRWQKDKTMVQHHKIIVMRRIGGQWLVEVETTSDQKECYSSRFAHEC